MGAKKEGRWRSERHPPVESRQLQESKMGRNISDKQCEGGSCVEDRKFPSAPFYNGFCFAQTQNLVVGDVFVIFTPGRSLVRAETSYKSHPKSMSFTSGGERQRPK